MKLRAVFAVMLLMLYLSVRGYYSLCNRHQQISINANAFCIRHCAALHCQHYIKRDTVIYIPINIRQMGGFYRPVAPLMLRSRGAVHQPVNSLPSGWPSTSPLYGISHLNNPSLCPSPTAPMLCLLCPRPSLVYSFPCLRSCFPTLARAESSDPHPPPPSHYSSVHPECPWHLWNCLCYKVLIQRGCLFNYRNADGEMGGSPTPSTSFSATTNSFCPPSQAHYPTCQPPDKHIRIWGQGLLRSVHRHLL